MKEYEVNFTAHHIINVEAENEDEARRKAIDLFDGDVKWENEAEEVIL